MKSYILKDTEEEKKILLYQEKSGYTFSPKKGTYRIKKITVLNEEMISSILKGKLLNQYKRIIQIIYSLINGGENTTSGDILVTYTEIDRLKNILLAKYAKYLDREFLQKYYQKLEILETELKKIHIMELEEEVENKQEKGQSR